MKAIVQDTYGSADVLELRDIDQPAVGHDDVLLRVHAAGVNPGVWHAMTGRPYLMRVMGFGLRRPKARIRGTDVAGRVEAVGKGVASLQPVMKCSATAMARSPSTRVLVRTSLCGSPQTSPSSRRRPSLTLASRPFRVFVT